MRLRKILKQTVDVAFGAVGLQLVKRPLDFEARPTGYAQSRMVAELAAAFDSWCDATQTWPVSAMPDTRSAVGSFYELYLASAFRAQAGGSLFNNLLWLHLLARATQPSLIIDSGTFRGASAWAFATACPDCPVFSFDLDLRHLAERTPGVTYVSRDWADYDFGPHDLGKALCYFDDHVDQGARLVQAVDRGALRLVFDDDFPVTSFFSMAHDGRALPKIEFLLDDGLRGVPELTWETSGRAHRWPIDHVAFSAMRSRIAATERLPNTSLITGIHQTPYRLVRGIPSATDP